jgi:Lipid A 3-O-deacylase (PagL)
MGFSATTKHEQFRLYDAFAVYGLALDWRHSSGWGVTPQIDAALGILEGGGKTGWISSVGPALVLNKQDTGFTTDLGISANLLDRRHFGSQDFGSILQFGAHLGINYRLYNGLKVGYRLQHLSNGHILYPPGTPNPGLDLHMFGISYVF